MNNPAKLRRSSSSSVCEAPKRHQIATKRSQSQTFIDTSDLEFKDIPPVQEKAIPHELFLKLEDLHQHWGNQRAMLLQHIELQNTANQNMKENFEIKAENTDKVVFAQREAFVKTINRLVGEIESLKRDQKVLKEEVGRLRELTPKEKSQQQQ